MKAALFLSLIRIIPVCQTRKRSFGGYAFLTASTFCLFLLFSHQQVRAQGCCPPLDHQIYGPYNETPGTYHIRTYFYFPYTTAQGQWISQAQAEASAAASMELLNAAFNVYSIYFVPPDGSCNTSQAEVFQTNQQSVDGMRNVEGHKSEDGLDIYVRETAGNASGWAFAVPGTYLTVSGNDNGVPATETAVLIKLVGHCLGLVGTQEHRYDAPQFCAGSTFECYCTGDFVCDTPFNDGSTLDCETGGALAKNYMNATGPISCRNQFTFEQGLRMRAYLEQAPELQQILIPTLTIPGATPSSVLSGNIVIESGVYTITDPLEMLPGASIRVKPGARLEVKSTVTGACGQMWQGVIVEGTTFLPQTPANQGSVEVRGSVGIIEHAACGIEVQNVTGSGDPINGTGGGIVTILGGQFFNNITSIRFGPYVYFSGGQSLANESDFYYGRFFTTDDYRGGAVQPTYVDLNGIVQLPVRKCFFEDKRTGCPGSSPRAIGIDSKNAGFRVNTGSLFKNLSIGIRADELNLGSGSFSVNSSDFNNCYTGIQTYTSSSFSIESNDFFLKKPTACPSAPVEVEGVAISGNTDGFTLSNNDFISEGGDRDITETLIGTSCIQTLDGLGNTIFKNNFEYLNYGNYAIGDNGYAEGGLHFLCNTYHNPQGQAGDVVDIKLEPQSVRRIQGEMDGMGNILPAGNSFTQGQTKAIENLGQQIEYHFWTGDPAQAPFPLDAAGIVPIAHEVANPNCATTEPCPPPCTDMITLAHWKRAFYKNKKQWQQGLQDRSKARRPQKRAEIEQQRYRQRLMMNKYSSKILMHYSHNSTAIQVDSILHWMKQTETYPLSLRLAKHYFFSNDLANYRQVWQEIPYKYELNEARKAEFDELEALFGLLSPHVETQNSLQRLPGEVLESLEKYAPHCTEAGFLARILLWRNGIKKDYGCVPLEGRSTASPEGGLEKEQASTNAEKIFRLFPNPASFTLQADYNNPNGSSILRLYDVNGQLALQYLLPQGEGRETLSLGKLKPGLYFYSLLQRNGAISRGRLFIIR